ncbi:hypothetical protein DEO72_LG11g2514 [Vigna unguiculata]|uniref:Uncharacterized protein n=1 Tax=Vigna unguiculata TaxID=3917 RepID=A0A4D6NNS6_VIGUN|nr:hypothetical protein DEO72_LG11g2514 [Vigna unguiculata]
MTLHLQRRKYTDKIIILALEPQSSSTSARVPTFRESRSAWSLFCSRNCKSGSRAVVLRSSVSKDLYEPISRKTVARPANLAQASQSRLGETNRDSPKPLFARKVAQATCSTFERVNISPRREGTRLNEIPCWLLVPPSSPRLDEGVPPERDPSA